MNDQPTLPLAAAPAPPYLAGLNPQQRLAVETLDGPVLVLSGAGTGKTRVLTTRLAHLLLTRRASPWQVLAVTFTNRAAREMRERVSALLGRTTEGWWMGTFHSLAARILRENADLVGLRSNFTILDTDDQIRLLKQLLEAEGIDDKKWPARVLMGVLDRWKDRGLTPDKLKAEDAGDVAGGRMVALYRAYQDRLIALNASDFGNLLLHNLTIFQSDAEVLARYQQKFRYVLVDEYQDTNVGQYLWLRLLAQSHRNLCCVGDDDQSIYGWRGAEVGNILRFESDFPGAAVIRLEQNYRSSAHILGAASGLIAHNRGRLGKTLWTAADGGEKVRVRAVWDGEEEARWVGEEIEAFQRRGIGAGQVAILVRAGFQTREFEERFITLGLPYRVVGGPRFYERQEIRDALAYFRLVVSAADDLAFERIINVPRRGVGPAAMQQLHTTARALGLPLAEAAFQLCGTDELKPKLRQTLRQLLTDLARWRDQMATLHHTDLARIVLDESGYTAMWQADRSPEAPGRLENLKELVAALAEFENLQGFLEHVALVMDANEQAPGDQVTLMTLHGAKGLEFDVVFLPGWEEGIFPSQRTLDESGIAGLEEERRLAYVGLTRARRIALVSHAANRRVYGTFQSTIPSRFVEEIPAAHVEVEADQGLFGGAQAAAATSGFGGGYRAFNEMGAAHARTHERRAAARPAGGPVIEGRAFEVPARPRPSRPYPVGAKVFHQKFGYGTVAAVSDDKLEIDFDVAGRKKVIDSFVKPADEAG